MLCGNTEVIDIQNEDKKCTVDMLRALCAQFRKGKKNVWTHNSGALKGLAVAFFNSASEDPNNTIIPGTPIAMYHREVL